MLSGGHPCLRFQGVLYGGIYDKVCYHNALLFAHSCSNSHGENSVTLELHRGDALARATRYAHLADEELRREAVRACHERDAEALWALTEAHLLLHGEAGAGISPHTHRTYRRGVLDLVDAWEGENLLRPGRDAGPTFLRTLEGRGLQPATVRVKLASARALYAALRWAQATNTDPFSDARPQRDVTAPWDKVQPYTEHEIQALLHQANNQDALLVLLGAHAGLRVSEILALTWQRIDLPGRRIHVVGGKGRRDRRVIISTTLKALLQTYMPKHGYLLPYRSQARAYQRLQRLCALAGVTSRGVHALRHYAGTRLAEEHDGNLEAAARHLGHATLETTRIYAKWNDQRLESSVGGW